MTQTSRTLGVAAFMAGSLSLQLPLTLSAQERNENAALTDRADRGSSGTCQIFGQVFGADPLAGEMLVKVPSGSVATVRFDQTTVFTAVSFDSSPNAIPKPLTAEQVNGGDWVCALTGTDVSERRAATVLVAPRQEIQRQQKDTLARWSGGGAFGTVTELNQKTKSFVLASHLAGNSKKRITVNTSEKTRFRRYLPDQADSSALGPASWAQVHLGDTVYVRGSSSLDAVSLDARSVIFGDLQVTAGTIRAIDPLNETVGLDELITDEAATVHVSPAKLGLMSAGPENAARVLQTIDFADIREGDSVIVLGRQNQSAGTRIEGVALIVNFGEPAFRGTNQQVTWKLIPVGLGLP
ncbi:MAG: hypothetical protein JWO80_2692 [Bryobacterales bacterium]|nr:hypothetical protein [Bryobacterales bacterium]